MEFSSLRYENIYFISKICLPSEDSLNIKNLGNLPIVIPLKLKLQYKMPFPSDLRTLQKKPYPRFRYTQ